MRARHVTIPQPTPPSQRDTPTPPKPERQHRGGYASSATPLTQLPKVPSGPAPGARTRKPPRDVLGLDLIACRALLDKMMEWHDDGAGPCQCCWPEVQEGIIAAAKVLDPSLGWGQR